MSGLIVQLRFVRWCDLLKEQGEGKSHHQEKMHVASSIGTSLQFLSSVYFECLHDSQIRLLFLPVTAGSAEICELFWLNSAEFLPVHQPGATFLASSFFCFFSSCSVHKHGKKMPHPADSLRPEQSLYSRNRITIWGTLSNSADLGLVFFCGTF